MESMLNHHWREPDVVASDTHFRQLPLGRMCPFAISILVTLGPIIGYFYPIMKTVQSADANDTFD